MDDLFKISFFVEDAHVAKVLRAVGNIALNLECVPVEAPSVARGQPKAAATPPAGVPKGKAHKPAKRAPRASPGTGTLAKAQRYIIDHYPVGSAFKSADVVTAVQAGLNITDRPGIYNAIQRLYEKDWLERAGPGTYKVVGQSETPEPPTEEYTTPSYYTEPEYTSKEPA